MKAYAAFRQDQPDSILISTVRWSREEVEMVCIIFSFGYVIREIEITWEGENETKKEE